MKDLVIFNNFAKGKAITNVRSTNCVIYTRVSTKEQADNNMSLETQRKYCELFAQKNGYNIMGYYGGTYESAKTDERNQFNKMLTTVKKSSQKISYIIVYSVDRFSRSGANAIYIAEQLKQQGISIISVTQPTDSTTASGSLQQNIQFIFSAYDNQLRREKSMTGTKESLLRGEWCTKPPLGYDIIRTNGVRKIVVNQTGKLLKKAFIWKAEYGYSSERIRQELSKLGIKLCHQRIPDILRNPFYCGLISHNLLEGKVVEGNHEKLVSRELFLKANNALDENTHGYKVSAENEALPLKRFIKCDTCGSYLRGYIVKSKGLYYYKCNTVGCGNNKSAKALNAAFSSILRHFSLVLNDYDKSIIKAQLIALYNQSREDSVNTYEVIEKQMSEIDKKIERLEERFMNEEFSKELYEKYSTKLLEERRELEQSLAKSQKPVSNLENKINLAIEMAGNLIFCWDSAHYLAKQKLQFMLFPEGISYNRKIDQCRTNKINAVFLQILRWKRDLMNEKSGIPELNLDYAALVVRRGIEPLILP